MLYVRNSFMINKIIETNLYVIICVVRFAFIIKGLWSVYDTEQ